MARVAEGANLFNLLDNLPIFYLLLWFLGAKLLKIFRISKLLLCFLMFS